MGGGVLVEVGEGKILDPFVFLPQCRDLRNSAGVAVVTHNIHHGLSREGFHATCRVYNRTAGCQLAQSMGETAVATTSESPEPSEPRKPLSRLLIRVAVFSYLGATLLGVVMRFEFVGARSGVPFDHLLHAHSHTLYFGWMALGLLAAGLPRFGRVTPALRRTAHTLVLFTPVLALGFLAVGYHAFTIAVSTAVMLGWYVVIVSWWRQLPPPESATSLAYRYALGYLAASSLGIWALAAIQATDGPALAQELAIDAFLLGFGWFVVFAITGSLMASRRQLGLTIDPHRLRAVLHGWGATAWATFALGVPGGPEVWGLGPTARLAGLLVIIPGSVFIHQLWTATTEPRLRLLIRLAALWFAVGLATTATAALGGSAALMAGGRQGVIIHLHATFVGFVAPLLVLALTPAKPRSLYVHHAALAVMLFGLVIVATGEPRTGMWIAAIGAIALWMAGAAWARSIVREDR